MNRYLVSGVCVGAVVLFSCTTEPCGCTPARTLLVVGGTVVDSDQTPVEAARIDFGEQRTGACAPTTDIHPEWASLYGYATTDAAGTFVADLYDGRNGEQCLIVTAVAGGDTARAWGAAEFRSETEPPDTLHVALTLGGD